MIRRRVLALCAAAASAAASLALGASATAAGAGPVIDTSSLYNGGSPCSTTTSPPLVLGYFGDILEAYGSDQDAAVSTLDFTFAIWPTSNPASETDVAVSRTFTHAALASARVPSGVLTTGTSYTWHVQVSDVNGTSAWSPSCTFLYDNTAPSEPKVTSSNYPNGTPGPIGELAHFTFDANGASDVVAFQYEWSSILPVFTCGNSGPRHQLVCDDFLNAPDVVRADTPGGTAAVALSPPDAGPQTLTVAALDSAGNRSDSVQYRIFAPFSEPDVTVSGGRVCGDAARFNFSPHDGVSDVISYRYAVGNDSSVDVSAGSDGKAHVSIPVGSSIFLRLAVRSVSASGFVSSGNFQFLNVDQVPGVESTDYPNSGDPTGAVGETGTFAFTPPTNFGFVSEYRYAFDGGAPDTVPANLSDSTATLKWAPQTPGSHALTVTAIAPDNSPDSCIATYDFVVAGSTASSSADPSSPGGTTSSASSPVTDHPSTTVVPPPTGDAPTSTAAAGGVATTGWDAAAGIRWGLLLVVAGAAVVVGARRARSPRGKHV